MSTYRAVGENLFIYSIELDLLAIFGYDLFNTSWFQGIFPLSRYVP